MEFDVEIRFSRNEPNLECSSGDINLLGTANFHFFLPKCSNFIHRNPTSLHYARNPSPLKFIAYPRMNTEDEWAINLSISFIWMFRHEMFFSR